jgi:hypothetical protein
VVVAVLEPVVGAVFGEVASPEEQPARASRTRTIVGRTTGMII